MVQAPHRTAAEPAEGLDEARLIEDPGASQRVSRIALGTAVIPLAFDVPLRIAESAALVCWLASEECSFSTASTFDTSGGRTTY